MWGPIDSTSNFSTLPKSVAQAVWTCYPEPFLGVELWWCCRTIAVLLLDFDGNGFSLQNVDKVTSDST